MEGRGANGGGNNGKVNKHTLELCITLSCTIGEIW